MDQTDIPLAVDLDGTLIRTDLLFEGFYEMVRRTPWTAFCVPLWLARGKACLKERIARQSSVDVGTLPYHPGLLAYLREEHSKGRKLVLATSAVREWADKVAVHLGIFAEVLATEGDRNLTGKAKLKVLVEKYGEKGFDYAGNDRPDLHIFPHARKTILVNPGPGVLAAAKQRSDVQQVFSDPQPGLITFFKTIRLYQWVKNFLLFVPLITSHNWNEPAVLLNAFLGFISFGLCASGGYVFNDLLDVSADRQHPRKKNRPLAQGVVPVGPASVLWVMLLALGLGLAAYLAPRFFAFVVMYCGLSLAYTLLLKTYVLIDVVVLAGLYTLRIMAGAVLIKVALSFWLFAFAIFIFFSLALIKRCSELMTISKANREYAGGRDYSVTDLEYLREMGIASGYMAILIFALYINSPDVLRLYSHPKFLWLACPVLFYWVSRLWLKTGRGEMADDPIVFTVKDRGSRVIAAALLIIVILAI